MSGEARPQIDVVVHNKKYPKLSFATGIDLFFIDSVSSFIEIKSRLTKVELRKAAATAKIVKGLANFPPQRLSPRGLVETPRPYSFVFAYEGPKRIETVLKWAKEISNENEYGLNDLKKTEPSQRSFFDHQFIDGIFVLGRGFIYLDALPFRSPIEHAIKAGIAIAPSEIWALSEEQELLMLWAMINEINARLLWGEADLNSYIGTINLIFKENRFAKRP